ncbi:Mg2+-importing ATPase [Bacteroides sp. HPS0048]|nr:Mg2+-importing ATPase [Bacteroides sp. HPS0048]
MIRRKKKNNQNLQFNAEKVFLAATQPVKLAYSYFQTTKYGLTDDEVKVRQQLYGKNEVIHEQKKRPIIVFCKAFINPFIRADALNNLLLYMYFSYCYLIEY